MGLEQTWRWYGPDDPVPLSHIQMAGATGIVTALHHIPNGVVWSKNEILERKAIIENEGLYWSVVESVPVHEDIKRRSGDYGQWIGNYIQTLQNLGECGIDTVCYNFMPVLDWTRTDLSYPMPDGSLALRFDAVQFAVFDMFILERKGASTDYTEAQRVAAEQVFHQMTTVERTGLAKTILMGLPGAEEEYSLADFGSVLETYEGIDATQLKQNLYAFLEVVIPVAEQSNIRMAIHPDDPPFPVLGLPRVVSTEDDARQLLEVVDSPNNGLCLCTGSYGVRADNDLPGMVDRLGHRINFIHLRSTARDEAGNFFEANHLQGDVDMFRVMRGLIKEQQRRKEAGRSDSRMPMRPDHGHQMLDDLEKKTYPGYSAIGRLRGLAELRGLEQGIRQSMDIT